METGIHLGLLVMSTIPKVRRASSSSAIASSPSGDGASFLRLRMMATSSSMINFASSGDIVIVRIGFYSELVC